MIKIAVCCCLEGQCVIELHVFGAFVTTGNSYSSVPYYYLLHRKQMADLCSLLQTPNEEEN